MKRFVLGLLVMGAVAAPAAQLQAAGVEGIVAVVNEDIITSTDLKDRAEMLLKSSGQPANRQLIQRVAPQALEGLISEVVQLQEARKQGIVITDEEVAEGIGQIAKNNNMSREQFLQLIRQQGVRVSSIEAQVRAQLGWGKVIQQVIRPRVIVGDSEIEAERSRLAGAAGKTEYLVAEIFLPVAKAEDDAKVRALAQTLSGEIRKGKPFPEAARQHSQSASAAQGGMIGWVVEGQLEPVLDDVVKNLGTDKVSAPVRGENGYHILYVRAERAVNIATPDDAVLSLRELVIDTSHMRERDAKQMAESIAKDLSGCLDITKKAASGAQFRLVERRMAIKELSETERARLGRMEIGAAVMPVFADNAAVISMVCGRDEPEGAVASDAVLEQQIGVQRLDMLQKRYLRDLIGAAYIERRV